MNSAGERYGIREDGPPQRNSQDEEAQLLDDEEYELTPEDAGTRNDGQATARRPRRPKTFFGQAVHFLHGPQPPKTRAIRPFFPAVQKHLIEILDSKVTKPRSRIALLAFFLLCWLVSFAVPLIRSIGPSTDASGHEIHVLPCTRVLWGRKNDCGVDGIDCGPFSNTSFAFRCPANCETVKVLNPRAVGPLDVNYRPLVVGGPVYRGDSFLCGAAIHAGAVTDSAGGCGTISRVGQRMGYPSTTNHSIESIGFDSYFPLSFTVEKGDNAQCGAKDPRNVILATSLFFTTVLCLFTSSPALMFFVNFIGIFVHVGLVSDPPSVSGSASSILPQLVSLLARRLLPALFCAVVLYWTCVRRTLDGLDAHMEKMILWLGGCWFGALSNYTFDWLPIQRLTAHDLEQQPGAKVALAVILVILTTIFVQQIYNFWLEGRLVRYLGLYAIFFLGIFICIALPRLELRIHHYILALLLLPGTSMQTRSSLLYQGLLLGLFINGVARWGFDSVLQTADELRGDATLESAIPIVSDPVMAIGSALSNITLSWASSPYREIFDGVSIMINDVERYRYFRADDHEAIENFTWTRQAALGLPEYFRFAYLINGVTMDYSKAATWHANGSWTPVPPKDGSMS